MAFIVTIRQPGEYSGEPISVEMGDTILATALAKGLPFPHSCQAGNCGSCKVRLIAGDVDMTPYSEFALTEDERADRIILACRSVPWEDCEIELLDDEDFVVHPQRNLVCRVDVLDDLTHDIKRVVLAIQSGGPFSFSAGQYAEVAFSGRLPRDYSMANRPDDDLLEFHVRNTGGAVSRYIHDTLQLGDTVHVDGPLGTAHLREDHDRPILAIAGGSGLAPIKSIVETAIAKGIRQPIHLYFGARRERDLYLVDHFRALSKQHTNFSYTPVLSEPDRPTAHRTGYVGDVALADHSTLNRFKTYLAGPPAMVEPTTASLVEKGMEVRHIHADAFYTEAEKQALEKAS
jgi:CDP-4-dehydro-6-deoxyglucose reductase/ferredoxin-NAD(P)+ reductase (naphthalene dioxygenase ferredoxin-specific)